jgi:Spy/CpxP family protein refolding chaperone
MKRNVMIQASILAVFCLCAAGVAFGQRQMDPEKMADREVAAMKERLKLTDDQEKKVRPILVDSNKKQMEVRQKYNVQPGQRPSPEAMAAMKEARAETNKKLAEVLTKEQRQEYQKMMAERAKQGGGKKQK